MFTNASGEVSVGFTDNFGATKIALSCYVAGNVGETNRHFATRSREHLSSDKNSHIFKHLFLVHAFILNYSYISPCYTIYCLISFYFLIVQLTMDDVSSETCLVWPKRGGGGHLIKGRGLILEAAVSLFCLNLHMEKIYDISLVNIRCKYF